MFENNLPFGITSKENIYTLQTTSKKIDMLENLSLSLDEIFRLEDATVNNELIAEYYEAIQKCDRAENIRKCGKNLFFNEYKRQNIYDLQKVFLCHDTFCINCQRYKSKTNVIKYSPIIEKVQQNYEIYLLTYTETNTTAENYKKTLKKMAKSYFRLHRFLIGTDKIGGIDFSELGYVGSVRAHETTFTETTYHPHGHALLALSKDLFLKKNLINDYSYSYKTVYKEGRKTSEKVTRSFCDWEILIQKIWYLMMNDIEVTKKNIDGLEQGYSCTLDKADNNSVLEVFKYSIKSFGEDSKHLTQEQFNIILNGITGQRMIESYGVFRIKQDTESIDQETVMGIYDEVIMALNLIEKPNYNVHKNLWNVKEDMLTGNKIYINRRTLFSACAEDKQDISSLIIDRINIYNKSHKRKIEVNEFFSKARQIGEMRKVIFESSKEQKLKKQKEYRDRSRARTKYVKEKLKAQGKSVSDPKYKDDFLKLKVEYNNLYPKENIVDITGLNLPF